MRNRDVAIEFANRKNAFSVKGSNYYTKGNCLYSYSTLVAEWQDGVGIYVTAFRYSVTTSKQLGYLKRELQRLGYRPTEAMDEYGFQLWTKEAA